MQLVFDIGGTKTRIAVSSNGQTLLRSKIIPTPKDFVQGLQAIKQVADELAEGENITTVAGGIAGPLNHPKTMLLKSPHLSNWIKQPLKTELERVFNAAVKLENDTALGGLGEARFGEGKNSEIVVYIAIGTGVGGVRITNGQIDKNSLGFEPGHQIIVPDGNDCNCGGKGHLEAYVAGAYLEKIYHQKGEDIKDPKIWDQLAKYLAIGLHNSIVHWSPDIVVLGGSVTQSIPLESVQEYLKEYLTIFPEVPQINKAALVTDAGLYGALALLSLTT